MGTTGEVRAYFGRSKPPFFCVDNKRLNGKKYHPECTKTHRIWGLKAKNFLGMGHSPLPRPYLLGAFGASILALVALDLDAYGASSSACLHVFWAVSPPLFKKEIYKIYLSESREKLFFKVYLVSLYCFSGNVSVLMGKTYWLTISYGKPKFIFDQAVVLCCRVKGKGTWEGNGREGKESG